MKTLNQILEVYSPKSADEKRFVKKHIVVKTADVAGNGDDVFTGSNVKEIDRKTTRKGYNTKDSEAVYEAKKPMSQAEKDKVVAGVRAAMRKSYDNVMQGRAQLAAAKAAAARLAAKDKTAKEEIEQADEGIGTLAVKAAGVVKDVISKERAYQAQKQKKAGEVLNKMRATKEEIEQVNELSKETLSSYLKQRGSMVSPRSKNNKGNENMFRAATKLSKKVAKEEIEQVDELKKSTLRSYVDKAKAENLPGKGGNRGVALLTPGTRDKGVHKAVARMKKMKEEVEVNEVLKVSAGAGEWIKDFQTSDNPKFAGKSKEQRKQQALAAFYAAKRAGKE